MLLGMRSLAFLLAFVFSISLFAQAHDPESKEEAKCDAYERAPLPTEASMIATPKQWPECASYKLYSGIGMKVDFEAARKCAWAERSASQADLEPRYTVGSVFGGSAMLTVLYANGEGIKRDIPLALRFACEAGGSTAELEGRTASLKALGNSAVPPKNKFDFCGDITSGFMSGFCASRQAEMDDLERTKSLLSLSMGWTSGQTSAFDTLIQAEQVYAMAHGRGEINLSGTARGMEETEAEQMLRDNFVAAVRSFEKVELAVISSANSPKVGGDLNELYRGLMASAEVHKAEYGAVQPEGIRTAERAWLKYRDAWVAFAKLRYPTVSTEAWTALLTKDRIRVLTGTRCEVDPEDGACKDLREDGSSPRPLP